MEPTAVPLPPSKKPQKRNYQEDEYQNYLQQDVMKDVFDLSAENLQASPIIRIRINRKIRKI